MSSKLPLILGALFLFALFSTPILLSQIAKPYAPSNGIAVDGYDVVTFFEEKAPIKGSEEHSLTFEGLTWYFVKPENLAKFQQNPELYLPQYKGYCAWALREGRIREGVAGFWMVDDGRLYLLCNQEVLNKWKNNFKENKARADQEWENREKSS